MKRRVAIVVLVLLAVLAAALNWLGSSEAGLQWVYRQAQPHLPQQLEITGISGRLFGPIAVARVRYIDAAQQVEADDIIIEWNPWALLAARLDIDRLESSGLRIELAADEAASATPPAVPEIALPLGISVDRLAIDNFRLVRDGQTTVIDRIESAFSTLLDRLDIDALALRAELWQLDLDGAIRLNAALDHDLGLRWQATLPSAETLQGQGRIAGNLQLLRLQQRLDGAARADLDLELESVLEQLKWRGELRLDDFDPRRIDPQLTDYQGSLQLAASGDLRSAGGSGLVDLSRSPAGPVKSRFRLDRISFDPEAQSLEYSGLELDVLDAIIGASGSFAWAPPIRWQVRLAASGIDAQRIDPQMIALQGGFEVDASGDLRSASASGRIDLTQSPAGPLQGRFRLDRLNLDENGESLEYSGLELDLLDGRIGASGSFAWAPTIRWRAQVAAGGIDPQVILEQWPGRIDAAFSVDGEIEQDRPVVALDIASLSGELRGYPVKLRGAAAWRDNTASFRGVEFASGSSRVRVDGSLGQSFDFKWSLSSDDLAELLPEARGRIKADGRLAGKPEQARITAKINGRQLEYPDATAARVDADVEVELDLNRVMELAPRRLAVALEASEVTLQQQRIQRLKLKTDSRRSELSVQSAEGAAGVELVGELSDTGWQGKLVNATVQSTEYGTWRLLAPAAITATPQSIRLDALCLDNPRTGKACADVDHGPEGGSLRLDLRKLPLKLAHYWMPDDIRASGLASARADLTYRLPEQLHGEIEVDLAPGQVVYRQPDGKTMQIDYQQASLRSELRDSGVSARLELAMDDGNGASASAELPGANLLRFDAEAQPVQARVKMQLRELTLVDAAVAQIERLRGQAELDLEIGGRLGRPEYNGTARLRNASLYLPAADLELEQLEIEAKSVDLRQADYRVRVRVAGGKLDLSGRTTLDEAAGWPSRVKLAAEQLDLPPLVQRYLPGELQVEGRLDVGADIELALPDRLTGKITLASSSGSLSYPLDGDEPGRWTYRDIKFEVDLGKGIAELKGGFGIGENRARARLRVQPFDPFAVDTAASRLDGEINLGFADLSLIDALLPDIQRTSGSLQLQLTLGGSLAAPELRGRAELRDAGSQIVRLGLNLEQINLTADSDADGVLRFRASLHSGEGRIEIEGNSRLDAAAGWPSNFTIRGENFEIARIPEARVSVSPQLEIKLAGKSIEVNGEVRVPYARLQPRDISTAARVSSDAVVVGEEQVAAERWTITSNVRLILGNRVTFFGYGLDARLGGNLLIEESPGKPTRGSGEITIIEGRYRAYGQHLNVENGRLLFSGGLITNPGLDIRAIRQTNDVTAGIKVTGRLQSPKVELFSNPAMGQTDTLSYLLTGGPLDSATSGQGAMLANAALALGLAGGDQIARTIGDRFGIDEMRIETSSSGDQASLVVGRYLSPKLYVGYGVGLIESINTINLRYDITERWQLEAESGEQQGADLLYRFER